MRLGQLSRKLSVRPSDILEFLSTNNIRIENDSNARLDDAVVNLIIQHFAPEQAESNPIDSQPEPDLPDTAPTENTTAATAELVAAETPAGDQEQVEEVSDGVIKAPKIELSGLKILGKIDLPERKKKETSADAVQPSSFDVPSSENKRPDRRLGKEQPDRRRKNPVALQREREALEEEKKRQERVLREKEKKTQNYLRRVKTAAPTKSARILEEPTEELSKVDNDAPTTLLGRFLRWLRN